MGAFTSVVICPCVRQGGLHLPASWAANECCVQRGACCGPCLAAGTRHSTLQRPTLGGICTRHARCRRGRRCPPCSSTTRRADDEQHQGPQKHANRAGVVNPVQCNPSKHLPRSLPRSWPPWDEGPSRAQPGSGARACVPSGTQCSLRARHTCARAVWVRCDGRERGRVHCRTSRLHPSLEGGVAADDSRAWVKCAPSTSCS